MRTVRSMNMKWSLGSVSAAAVALFAASTLELKWPTANADPWVSLKPAGVTETAASAKKLNDEFSALAERVSPAVVNIYIKDGMRQGRQGARPGLPQLPNDQFDYFFEGPFSQPFPGQPREALGSGFVINETDGYIVTNAHVVRMAGKNADEIMVKFNGEENGKGHLAKVIGADELTDVALLKLVTPKKDMKAIPLGDSDKAKVGEWVIAVGNPYGHTNTVTQGIVSAIGRSLEGVRTEFMQTSASINPGNSGGPLVNLNGEVIAINTAIDPRAQGIGFAIPVNGAKRVIEQLVSKGHVSRAWLGIAIEDMSDEVAGYMRLKNPHGVLVKQVMPGQPAAKAGMESYDVITKVDNSEIKNTRDLFRSIEKLEVGKAIDVEVLRSNEFMKLKIKLSEQPVNS